MHVAADRIRQKPGFKHTFCGAEAERAAAMPDIEDDAAAPRLLHLLAHQPVWLHRRIRERPEAMRQDIAAPEP